MVLLSTLSRGREYIVLVLPFFFKKYGTFEYSLSLPLFENTLREPQGLFGEEE